MDLRHIHALAQRGITKNGVGGKWSELQKFNSQMEVNIGFRSEMYRM